MKIDFKNSIRRLSFLCCLPDIKIAWINPCWGIQWKDFKVKIIQKRNFWNQQNFIVLFWWQNIDPKQWIWWTSSLLSELIIKKQLSFHKSFFVKDIVLIFSLIGTVLLSSCKNIVLIFSLIWTPFLLSFVLLYINGWFEYSADDYTSPKIIIEAVMKNSEMLRFIPDHLKTKKICKHAVKKLPFVIRYVPDSC